MPGIRDVLRTVRETRKSSPLQGDIKASRILELSGAALKAAKDSKGEVCFLIYGKMQDDGFHVTRTEAQEAPKKDEEPAKEKSKPAVENETITPEDVMGMKPKGTV